MKVLTLVLLAALAAGCESTTAVQNHMVIAPDSVVFLHADSAKTVSITHTCTCPFYWNATYADSTWLVFPHHVDGDHDSVVISILRAKLPADINRDTINVVSNGYGSGKIVVIAYK